MNKDEIINNCPHCGIKLSPWQKVLLNVDRAIVCKNCWYRIILPTISTDKITKDDANSNENEESRGEDGNI